MGDISVFMFFYFSGFFQLIGHLKQCSLCISTNRTFNKSRFHFIYGIYPQTVGGPGKRDESKRGKSVRFSPFPRIFRFLLLCRTDVLVTVSHSVFDAENDGEVHFALSV